MASSDSLDTPFDYVIIGGGTSGLVVASRLSEDADTRVLVVEAGGDRTGDPLVTTPGLAAALYGKGQYDWDFTSVPQVSDPPIAVIIELVDPCVIDSVSAQPSLYNRSVTQARGKMLGGSSALNFMMLLYPSKHIIDCWEGLGNRGWNYDSLSPYLRKFATVHPPSESAREVVNLDTHQDSVASGDGPIQSSFSEGYGPANTAWMDTFCELDLAAKTDPREGKAVGAFQSPATIDPVTKTRSFAASAYYGADVAQRPNLVVLTETVVTKIIFDTTGDEAVATGVEIVTEDGETKTVSTTQEVILAAGALHSPQILELSGVGGKELLEKHGIPVIIDNPNVGEGMQDHPLVLQSFEVAEGVPTADILRDPHVTEVVLGMYMATADGPLGQSNVTCAYAPLVDGSGVLYHNAKQELFAALESNMTMPGHSAVREVLEAVDGTAFQYIMFPAQAHVPDEPCNMATHITPTLPENYVTILTLLNHPFSRGSVHITSNKIGDLPAWDPKYNDNPIDLELLARGVQYVEHIVGPNRPFGMLLKPGGKRLPEIVGYSLENAKEIVRKRQISCFHVSGSCSMLPRDEYGVVDNRLRVYGVKNLRVVDASVFPLEPSGNIQSVVYAVAEKAADLIKEDRAVAAKAA